MTIILVGSNSIHTLRFLNAISNYFEKVIFITNNIYNLDLPQNVETCTINFKFSNFKARFQIANIIKKHPKAIVHIHQANSYAYHTLKAIKNSNLKNKSILTTWGSDILVLPNQNRILKSIVKYNLNSADIITSDSLFMSFEIKKLCPSVKELHTINFGMQNFPQQLDMSKKENIILSNRLHKPLYNIDKIIEAFSNLLKQNSNYNLVIAASGSETESLKSLAHKLKIDPTKIIFTGMVSYLELIELYKKAKIFISIPSSDATSISLLESMAYGCYPILSNLPANLEWVIDGINGKINQSNLSNDILNAINLNIDKYEFAVEFNYKLIKEKAVFEDNIKKFLDLYLNI